MAARTIALIAVLALATACSHRPAATLVAGDAVPAGWVSSPGEDRATVIWAFRTGDCFSCASLDYSIRGLQRVYPSVAFSAVHVGGTEKASIPRAYFNNRRIRVSRAVDIPPREFRKMYGDAPLPLLLITSGERIIWSSDRADQPRLTEARIDSLFGAHFPLHPAEDAGAS